MRLTRKSCGTDLESHWSWARGSLTVVSRFHWSMAYRFVGSVGCFCFLGMDFDGCISRRGSFTGESASLAALNWRVTAIACRCWAHYFFLYQSFSWSCLFLSHCFVLVRHFCKQQDLNNCFFMPKALHELVTDHAPVFTHDQLTSGLRSQRRSCGADCLGRDLNKREMGPHWNLFCAVKHVHYHCSRCSCSSSDWFGFLAL